MRLYAPLYEGDGFRHPGPAVGERTVNASSPLLPETEFRGDVQEAARNTQLDLLALERAARAARGVWIARKLRAMHDAVVNWLDRIEHSERDNFFAGACDLPDLERRIKHFERTGVAHY